MAKITLEEQPEYPTLPPDSILELKVDEVTVKTQQGARGEWTKVEIKFKILGIQATGDGSPIENYDALVTQHIWGSVPFRLTDSPENKLRMWSEAILGVDELGVGFELDTDMFEGRKVRGITSQYDAKSKDSKGVPFKRHQIDSLLKDKSSPVGAGAPVAQSYTAPPAGDPWATPAGGSAWDEPPF